MHKLAFVLLSGAAILIMAGASHAAGNSPQRPASSMVAAELPAVDMDTTVFVDADGDGINDRMPRMRREDLRALDQEREQSRGQMLNQAMAGLTKEQKDEIKQLRTAMRRQGASPDQIHAAVGEKIRSYGVAVPAEWDLTANEYSNARRMTAQRRAQVQALADSLRAQGKTPAEIRAAIAAEYSPGYAGSRRTTGMRPAPGGVRQDSLRGAGRPDMPAGRDSLRHPVRPAGRDTSEARGRAPRPERGGGRRR
ncbi:MAG TPA: hypothetical protein PLE60_10385 [Candidatus Latescibacteria bacterium]|nr:hypothetical protein [Candidatus Latescibacterota bacterium]